MASSLSAISRYTTVPYPALVVVPAIIILTMVLNN